MDERIETVIVGGGQGGLSTSCLLTQSKREHIVLEQSNRPAHVWEDERWDSFTFVTPNWAIRLPGTEYDGRDPDGYLSRGEIAAFFSTYVDRFRLPIQCNSRAYQVAPDENGIGFRVETSGKCYHCTNVVIATGLYQRPKVLPLGYQFPRNILQLHSTQYRNPQSLPPGAILVVGSAQSGCQIAEELSHSGRQVYLSVGRAGRIPRRYRGKDIYWWVDHTGFLSRTPDKLPSLEARFAGNPHLTGKDGGHTISLHQFARDGITLLGRIQSVRDGTLLLAPDLHQNLARADKFAADMVGMIDAYVDKAGLDLPREELPILTDGFRTSEIAELDLVASGIATVIWANGYEFDFDLVHLPVVDKAGFPIQQGGISEHRGLYFVGMPWLSTQRTGTLLGVGDNASQVVSDILSNHEK